MGQIAFHDEIGQKVDINSKTSPIIFKLTVEVEATLLVVNHILLSEPIRSSHFFFIAAISIQPID